MSCVWVKYNSNCRIMKQGETQVGTKVGTGILFWGFSSSRLKAFITETNWETPYVGKNAPMPNCVREKPLIGTNLRTNDCGDYWRV